ncbi:MAG: hypothetical protein C4518_08460 [Desulfobacteraceae bacterium]|nr:MAG: hypothetical protein C4518_08460 [Desulfobacteraceae bacterium]
MAVKFSKKQLSDIQAEISGKSGEVRLPCPLCDRGADDKALSVNSDSGKYICHRCGVRGGLISSTGQTKPISKINPEEKKSLDVNYYLQKSKPANDHPYLKEKCIKPYGVRIYKDMLLVPLRKPGNDKVQALQFINQDGNKPLARGSAKRGACFILGSLSNETEIVYLCEGFATNSAVFEALEEGPPVVMCVDAGNMKSVAVEIRKKFPKVKIVLCADNDRHRAPDDVTFDIGYRKARDAAKAVSGSVVMPSMPGMDFNDLAKAEGLETVRDVILAGGDPGPAKQKDNQKPESPVDKDKPVIQIKGGELSQIADMAEALLIGMGAPFYALNGQHLVRPVVRPSEKWEPCVALEGMTVAFLVDRMTRRIVWLKFDGRSEAWLPKDAPKAVAETILARSGVWKFPPLLGVGNCPTIRPDGSLIIKPGYDPETRYFFHFNGNFPEIAENPGMNDALAALDRLREAVSTYRFADNISESVAVAALIAGVIRPALDHCPFCLVSAPVAGSGKSQLVDGIAVLGSGAPASTINAEASTEELTALLDTLLIEGAAVVNLDNLNKPVTSARICQLLTQSAVTVRIKGFSRSVTISPRYILCGTGNNAGVIGDLARRTITAVIDPGCERPQDRRFDMPFPDYCLKHRADLVRAVLVVVRAYAVAGCPDQGLSSTGSFETWSRWVRCPLVWLGMQDPWRSQDALTSQDESLQNLIAVLEAWFDVYGRASMTGKYVIARCKESNLTSKESVLRDALENIAVDKKGEFNPRMLGHFLRKNQNRIVRGYQVKAAGEDHRAICWQVSRVDDDKDQVFNEEDYVFEAWE